MKTLSFLTLLVLATVSVQAAPAMQASDFSDDALKGIATSRQKASIERYHKAVAKAEKNREKAKKEAEKLTQKNDIGMKKTIQHRYLNSMLPASERTPEAPRKPSDYTVRY